METLQFIWGIVKDLRDLMLKIWSKAVLITPFLTACGILWTGLFVAYNQLDSIPGLINSGAAHVTSVPGGSVLAAANRIFPISEYLMFLGSILSLRLLAMTIRVIKSFIPSISG